jgi:polysaccharide export outer membrane protein
MHFAQSQSKYPALGLVFLAFYASGVAQNVTAKRADGVEKASANAVMPAAIDDKRVAESAGMVPDLHIGPGDLLEIKVFGAPELQNQLRVSSGGDITMPLIGPLKVAGSTPEDAQKAIETRLLSGGYLRDPHVNVQIKEFATQGISVLGEVAHPGVYPLLGSRRLFDALAAAGGTTTRAGKTVVITHRATPEAQNVLALARNPQESAKQNVELQPGDTVIIAKAGIVYVSGDVRMPGGYVMDNNENLTVLQAVALAQGLNATASANNARIIRRNSGTLEQIPVQLKAIMASKSPDIALENEDVLFVPNSASKSAARRSLESIVQVATGLAIYRR